MIRVVAAPTEIVLSSGSCARTYRLLREVGTNNVSVDVHLNELRTEVDAFPPNVSIPTHQKSNGYD